MADSDDMVKIKFYIYDGYANKGQHILMVPKEEWESMNAEEREQYMWNAAIEKISISWDVA
jgi:hypothetical protein